MNHKDLTNTLKSIGWQITEFQNEENGNLEGDVCNKVSRTSAEFQSFIKLFSVLANQEDEIWLLSFNKGYITGAERNRLERKRK